MLKFRELVESELFKETLSYAYEKFKEQHQSKQPEHIFHYNQASVFAATRYIELLFSLAVRTEDDEDSSDVAEFEEE